MTNRNHKYLKVMCLRIILFSISIVFVTACKNHKEGKSEQKDLKVDQKVSEFTLEVYNFDGFQKFLEQKNDTIYVVNFWATWCAPCVKELPYFDQLNAQYKNVEVLLVSLDFPNQYETKLKPFVEKNNIQSKVIALDDVDMNSWIPKVDKDWSGALPATYIYKNEESKFFEQSFTYDLLKTEVEQFLK